MEYLQSPVQIWGSYQALFTHTSVKRYVYLELDHLVIFCHFWPIKMYHSSLRPQSRSFSVKAIKILFPKWGFLERSPITQNYLFMEKLLTCGQTDKAALALGDNNSYRRRWLCVRNCDFSKKFFSKKKRLNQPNRSCKHHWRFQYIKIQHLSN